MSIDTDLDVDSPVHYELKNCAYDQFSLHTRDLGRFSMRVYGPSDQQVQRLRRGPGLNSAFAPGWAQGHRETNHIAALMAHDGHMRFTSVKLPDGNHTVGEMVPFHAALLRSASSILSNYYPDVPQVVTSYSRGSNPGTVVAGEQGLPIDYVAATWFDEEQTEKSLMFRGISEAVESVFRLDSIADKAALARMGIYATREGLRRTGELYRDVSAIKEQSRPGNLIEHLAGVPKIGVVIGKFDRVCPERGIRTVAQEIGDSKPEREVDIITVDSGHFHVFKNNRSRREIVDQIYRLAS